MLCSDVTDLNSVTLTALRTLLFSMLIFFHNPNSCLEDPLKLQ